MHFSAVKINTAFVANTLSPDLTFELKLDSDAMKTSIACHMYGEILGYPSASVCDPISANGLSPNVGVCELLTKTIKPAMMPNFGLVCMQKVRCFVSYRLGFRLNLKSMPLINLPSACILISRSTPPFRPSFLSCSDEIRNRYLPGCTAGTM